MPCSAMACRLGVVTSALFQLMSLKPTVVSQSANQTYVEKREKKSMKTYFHMNRCFKNIKLFSWSASWTYYHDYLQSYITWKLWRLKWPATRQFVQKLVWLTTKKSSKIDITGQLWWESYPTVTGGIFSHWVSQAESVSLSWRHIPRSSTKKKITWGGVALGSGVHAWPGKEAIINFVGPQILAWFNWHRDRSM